MAEVPLPKPIWIGEEEATRLIDEITQCGRYAKYNVYRQFVTDGRLTFRGRNVLRQSIIDAVFCEHPDRDAKYRWMVNDLIRHHQRQGCELKPTRAARIIADQVFPDDADQANQMFERIRKP